MDFRTSLALASLSACTLLACSHSIPRQPPGLPPSPKTITREEPGGDAHDPLRAAHERLARESWGWRADKRDVFHFPLSDTKNWRRVRFWGVPSFVGFRYGDKHHAVAALWARKLREGDAPTADTCMKRFEDWGNGVADQYSTRISEVTEQRATWREPDDVLVKTLEAQVKTLLSRRRYLGVVGATIAWPGVCVAYGYAFDADDVEEPAREARDRYAREAFKQLARIPEAPPANLESF